ncbi:hypothetical protein ASPCAL07479 [Aspergillus calidoustus]|uniref:Endo-1,3(4)-beta-glucanase n=1 Tax=Aspergillus calidoustus TaxID=454130 RepID=A0A0U4Z9C9_ASPCI|nr:hypothetical protein ASPCAL07479 [Aspergillus calidoustus]
MDDNIPKPLLSGPYNPEIFASQLSRITSRFLEPDAQVRPEFIRKPDPFTLYLGYWGTTSWQVKYSSLLVHRLQDASYLVNRELTQPELDAYVESHNVLVSNYTRGIPLGFLTGGAKWLLYEKNYKHFLQYAPPAGQQGMTPLRRFTEGTKMMYTCDRDLAKNLLLSLTRRLLVYTCVGALGLEVAGVIMSTQQVFNDPRMAQHREDAKKVPPETLKARRAQATKDRLARKNQAAQSSDEPTPQNGGYDESGYAMDSGGMGSATASGTTAYPSSGTASASATGTYSYGSRAPAEQSKGTGFFDDDDDASPTAPEYRGIVRRENAAAGQGSAWERLRNQSQSGIPSESGSVASGGSAWNQSEASVSASDSQRERKRAQAEFNRLLDAERNQSNDGSNRGAWR